MRLRVHNLSQPTITRDQIDAAASQTNTDPTDAQRKAGNYRKGKISWHGLHIAIENPRGSVRSGTDSSGKRWRVRMAAHYGYFLGVNGKDRDPLDVFIGPHPESELVFVIDQKRPASGEFDEHKVVIGVRSAQEAHNLYMRSFSPGWAGFMACTPMTLDHFKTWMHTASMRIPASRYTHFQPDAAVVGGRPGRKVRKSLEIHPAQDEDELHPGDDVSDMRHIWDMPALRKAIDKRDGGTLGMSFDSPKPKGPQLLSDEEFAGGVPWNDQEKPKVLAHRSLPKGTNVGVRLNLNLLQRTAGKHPVQSIHEGSYKGKVIGYDQAVTVKNPRFVVNQAARAAIASGRRNKEPMASVDGELQHGGHSFDGVEVRFNPRTSHLFTRADNGWAVSGADEATVHGHRAYVRGNIQYWHPEHAPEAREDIPTDVKFRPANELTKAVESGQTFHVYHGTNMPFDTFDNDRLHSTFSYSDYPAGHYFTPQQDGAELYGRIASRRGGEPHIIEAQVHLKNPRWFYNDEDARSHAGTHGRDDLIRQGHDGAVIALDKDRPHEPSEVIAFHPHQIAIQRISRADELTKAWNPFAKPSGEGHASSSMEMLEHVSDGKEFAGWVHPDGAITRVQHHTFHAQAQGYNSPETYQHATGALRIHYAPRSFGAIVSHVKPLTSKQARVAESMLEFAHSQGKETALEFRHGGAGRPVVIHGDHRVPSSWISAPSPEPVRKSVRLRWVA